MNASVATSAPRASELLAIERDLAIELGRARRLSSALDAILDAVVRLGEVDSGGVYLFDPTGGLTLAAHRGLGPEFIAETREIPAADPRVALVRSGKPLFASFAQISRRESPAQKIEQLRASAVLPVLDDDEVVAVLNVASHTVDELSQEVRDALVGISAHIGGIVERVRAEASVRSSQENFQSLFDSLNDFLFVLDERGRIIHTNAVVQRRLGYAEHELVGMDVAEVHPEARRDEALRIVGAMLAGTAAVCPIPLRARDGKLIAVETVVSRGHWSGRPAILGISRDITRRKAAEDALHASEAMHRAIVDRAPLGIARLDGRGRYLQVNAAFARMVGREAASLVGLDLAELSHPDDVGDSIAQFRRLMRGEVDSYRFEKRYVRPDGRVVWAELSATAVRSVEGTIDFVLGLVNDVTARKDLEATQAEVDRRFRQMANAAPVLMWGADAKGVRTFFNRTWHEFTGRSTVEELGDGWLEGVHEDDRGGLATFGDVDREYRLRDRSGELRWLLERVSPVRGADGALQGYLGSCIDITDRKRTEQEREALLEELKHALATVKTLRGLLPMCAWCKKVRDDQGYWSQIESFLHKHSEAELSHGLCPDCEAQYFSGPDDAAADE